MFNLKKLGLVLLAATLSACGGSGDGDGGGSAQIRLLNLSTGYSSLDLMTNIEADEDDEDETQAEGVTLDTVSDYAELEADSYTIKVSRTGSGSVLRSFTSEELVEDTVNTYIAYGEVGSFGALKLDDTQDDADAGETKLSVANLSSAGALDVYITEPNVDLDDTTPVLSGVGTGFNGLVVDSGTFRLRATAAGDTSDVRLDIANFNLADKGVAALIFTSTQGGMLANATYIPQGGQPTKLLNTKSRVRAAVATATGTSAAVAVGGTSILSASTAGVIGSRYILLDSGSRPVTLTVAGNPVVVPNATLAAGADYTLMVWTSAEGPTYTLVTDDNRLPSGAGLAKLRLLNGMSTLGAPLTLSLDSGPIIEGALLGEVSDEEEVTSGTDRLLEVSNTSTAAAVLTRSGVSLSSGGVYTFFLTDNGPTAIGVLRRDR